MSSLCWRTTMDENYTPPYLYLVRAIFLFFGKRL
jgi:hypothetical protein